MSSLEKREYDKDTDESENVSNKRFKMSKAARFRL